MNAPNTDIALHGVSGLIDSRRLLYFYHVAKAGRFTIAQTTLNVAQSALSRQLQQLEEDLGVRLFDRTGHGVRLTQHGRILLEHAEGILRDMAATIDEIREARHLPQDTVSIAAPPSFMSTYMADVVLAFNEERPEARIRALEASTGGVYGLLANEEVDLAVVVEPLSRSRLALRRLTKEPLYLVCAPDHPFAELDVVSRKALKDASLVLPASLHGSRAILGKYLQDAGIELRSQFEVDSLPLMRQLLTRRPVCTILPSVTCRQELDDGTLVARPLRPALSRTLYIASLKERPLSDVMRAAIKCINGTVKTAS